MSGAALLLFYELSYNNPHFVREILPVTKPTSQPTTAFHGTPFPYANITTHPSNLSQHGLGSNSSSGGGNSLSSTSNEISPLEDGNKCILVTCLAVLVCSYFFLFCVGEDCELNGVCKVFPVFLTFCSFLWSDLKDSASLSFAKLSMLICMCLTQPTSPFNPALFQSTYQYIIPLHNRATTKVDFVCMWCCAVK